jgi:hypothetical protein
MRERRVSLVGNPWKMDEPGTATSRSRHDDGFLTAKTKRPGLAMASFSLAIFVFTLHSSFLERSKFRVF